ncbi:MAG: MaoC/PaaZ C-terminal domain-containing protein [bacterium]
MAHPIRHVVHQGPVLRAMGSLAFQALEQRFRGVGSTPCDLDKTLDVELPPRDAALVADYIRWAGGDRQAWKGQVPHHLFAQWAFGLTHELLCGAPYPLAKAVNAGCRLEINGPIPLGEPLHVHASLEGIDDDGRRAIIRQRFVTSTPSSPDALVARLDALVPLGGGDSQGEKKSERRSRPTVPAGAREIGTKRLPANAGFEFACLTGDFNPLHWIAPYAKAMGFGRTILHGFGTLAIALETMNRVLWAGDTTRLTEVEVRFTRPVRLPGRFGIHVHDDGLFVGDAPGGPANLTGTFKTRSGR